MVKIGRPLGSKNKLPSARKGIKRFLKDAGVEWARVSDMGYGKYKIIIASHKPKESLMEILRQMVGYLHVDNFQIYFKKGDEINVKRRKRKGKEDNEGTEDNTVSSS